MLVVHYVAKYCQFTLSLPSVFHSHGLFACVCLLPAFDLVFWTTDLDVFAISTAAIVCDPLPAY